MENILPPNVVHERNLSIQEQAICVRHGYKRYGGKNDQCIVLDDLNMTVPKGSIYGLLGASGCGKTTLLGCMIGRKKLNSGEISILGCAPGSKGIPGERVGYMPQELALSGDFTIRETLHYFGGIAGMPNKKIEERLKFLTELLMLPDVDKFLNHLSCGQQRRVSLAATLLHEPELLILDEPTAGTDPVLRQMIWDHLVTITQFGATTVVITTHYIDETGQANFIGLMRGGYVLAEETPTNLLSQYNTTSLEHVFLRLSVKQNLTQHKENSFVNEVVDIAEIAGIDAVKGFGDNHTPHRKSIRDKPTQINYKQKPEFTRKISHYFPVIRGNHMRTLLWWNFTWLLRNTFFLLLMLSLPLVEISLFSLAIGHYPSGLSVAVVNYETGNAPECVSAVVCNSTTLSCVFLSYLQKNDINLVHYETDYKATQSVSKGKTYASIVIKQNYTKALQARIQNWHDSDSWDINASEIEVMRDVTNKDVANFLRMYLYDSFQKFIQDYLMACEINPRVISEPIQDISLKSYSIYRKRAFVV